MDPVADANTLNSLWPALTAVAALAAVVAAALHRPAEDQSRLYEDAMTMVGELQKQRAIDRAEIADLRSELDKAKKDAAYAVEQRRELEREVGLLYRRIERLEGRFPDPGST